MTTIEPGPDGPPASIQLEVNGRQVEVSDAGGSLLHALRDELGERAPKDGCAPQGQCGCCTVLVDGAPRVACVTPVRRVRGRSVVTPDALPDAPAWAEAFCATGASQCGFCTPGIIARLAALHTRKPDAGHPEVEQALLAHLCRCTGWRTILDAWDVLTGTSDTPAGGRDLAAASRRAELEGGRPQGVEPAVALGHGGFADDTAPTESLVAVLDGEGAWTLGDSVAVARAAAATVQGRRTTEAAGHPIAVPDPPPGGWDVVLQTSWVEPAYLETDASWARPGGDAADPLANGGAFGAKEATAVTTAARALADGAGRPVRALYSREDTVRLGPKRPPLAAGLLADGTGVVRVARTAGIADAIAVALPRVTVEEVDVVGPPTSVVVRGAGWAEAVVLADALDHARAGDPGPTVGDPDGAGWTGPVGRPETGTAWARVDEGTIRVRVAAGDPLDRVVLESYCVGAAHQAASWVTSEALTVDGAGEVQDLTIRSFGVLRAVDTPPIEVEIVEQDGTPVPVSECVFAAVAGAVWRAQERPPAWPTGVPLRAR